ncbi:MAG: DUF3267 domain-containing protein [Oscillospiraceae bacterium]|nr:DUF3267 domain-containing protein [Oscillospiraceae bacterium]
MLNIAYKGKLKSENQLIGDDKLPQKAVQFNEGENIEDLFNFGFVIELPIIIPIMLITIFRLENIEGHINLNLRLIFIIAVAFLLNYLLNFIHSILFPIKSEKTIWNATKGAYFIYCNAKISKSRFIVISLAPMIILGIIPFIIWVFTANKMEFTISLAYVILTWIMIISAMGDLANVYNTIKQVPRNAKVFNYGLQSYWINENPDLQ